jgi:hypothetical protein
MLFNVDEAGLACTLATACESYLHAVRNSTPRLQPVMGSPEGFHRSASSAMLGLHVRPGRGPGLGGGSFQLSAPNHRH